jgi:chromosome segregation ATPase
MVTLANPLQYPLAVLAGGLFLVVGARFGQLPPVVAMPGAVAITTLGAAWLKTRKPDQPALDNPALNRELQSLRRQAQSLLDKASALKAEATQLLTAAHQMELLGTVQYACDRSQELPAQLDQLARRLQGQDALLSVEALTQQLRAVTDKRNRSTGLAKTQWAQLAQQLNQNIQLARQGQDARQAQFASLSTLIAEAEGTLQQLQNKLRTVDLTQADAAAELRQLSDTFQGLQENVEVLVS